MPNAAAEAKKNEGNTLFKAGKFAEAIAKYNEATDIDPSMHTAFSNCAACHEKLGNFKAMEEASAACINADPNFIKGYFRLATAKDKQNELKGALDALTMGESSDGFRRAPATAARAACAMPALGRATAPRRARARLARGELSPLASAALSDRAPLFARAQASRRSRATRT